MPILGGKLKSPEQRPKTKREEKPLWRSIHKVKGRMNFKQAEEPTPGTHEEVS